MIRFAFHETFHLEKGRHEEAGWASHPSSVETDQGGVEG